MGGGMRQTSVVSAPARVAVEETFLGGKLDAARERAREIARIWEDRGGKLQQPVETNMVWLDLEAAGCTAERFVERAVELGLKVIGGRLVVHYRELMFFLDLSSGVMSSFEWSGFRVQIACMCFVTASFFRITNQRDDDLNHIFSLQQIPPPASFIYIKI